MRATATTAVRMCDCARVFVLKIKIFRKKVLGWHDDRAPSLSSMFEFRFRFGEGQ